MQFPYSFQNQFHVQYPNDKDKLIAVYVRKNVHVRSGLEKQQQSMQSWSAISVSQPKKWEARCSAPLKPLLDSAST